MVNRIYNSKSYLVKQVIEGHWIRNKAIDNENSPDFLSGNAILVINIQIV